MMKKLSILFIILLVIVVSVVTFYKFNSNTKKEEDLLMSVKSNGYDTPILTIKSEKDHKIEMNDIELVNSKIYKLDNSLKVLTTIKNNTDRNLDGFLLMFELVDADGNTVFPMAVNSDEVIKSGASITVENYATIEEDTKNIVDLRLISADKTISNSVNEAFGKMGQEW